MSRAGGAIEVEAIESPGERPTGRRSRGSLLGGSFRQAYRSSLCGAFGAIVGMYLYTELVRVGSVWTRDALAGALIGGACGFVLNGWPPLRDGAVFRAARAGTWGTLAGAIGGAIGLVIGEWTLGRFQGGLIGRSVSWAILGLGLGISQGLAEGSRKKLLHGVIGGTAGGLLGGLLFEWLRASLGQDAGSVRLGQGVGIAILGAGLGLCLALVEQALRRAWVEVVRGRQEGRSYLIGGRTTRLGLDEHIEIGLFGDPEVARLHAEIVADRDGYALRNRDDRGRTRLNGQAVDGERPLADGDRIELGRTVLVFRRR